MPPPSGPIFAGREIRTIERQELHEKLEKGDDIKLVMTLGDWAFQAKHIPKSIHFNTPDEMLGSLRKDDEIVVYCSNPQCLASLAAYRRLVEHGYQNVRRYAGGLVDWEDGGLPLEGDWARASNQ